MIEVSLLFSKINSATASIFCLLCAETNDAFLKLIPLLMAISSIHSKIDSSLIDFGNKSTLFINNVKLSLETYSLMFESIVS